jgi:flavin-dependent dehydrogenase
MRRRVQRNWSPIPRYTALIVGAGPAGCAAAISCAQAGLPVLILEADLFPRDRPGESLHPGVEPLLSQLGVLEAVLSAGFVRHTGIWHRSQAGNAFVPFGSDAKGQWKGFQALRSKFDSLLLHHASAVGADLLQPVRALRPIVSNGRVIGVETDRGPLPAQHVLDGTGGRRWLSRHLSLPATRYSCRKIALYGYATGSSVDSACFPAFEEDDEGWTWRAHVGPSLYAWVRQTSHAQGTDRSWTPPDFRSLASTGPSRGVDVTWSAVAACAGPGYFLLGDAAAVLDPSSSHGVLRAMMSGIMAAHAITRIAHGDLPEGQATRGYADWMTAGYLDEALRLSHLSRENLRTQTALKGPERNENKAYASG